MKPSDIRVNCTYAGKDNLHRKVTKIAVRGRKWLVAYREWINMPQAGVKRRMLLSDFARWAESEVFGGDT